MKPTVLKFKIERLARKTGGDRYELIESPKELGSVEMKIYIPQKISRPRGTVLETLTITIE